MISWTTDEVIHRIVKRDVPNSERGKIATLNDLPDWMVEEARAIARESLVGAVRYLRFYVATQYVSSAEDFVEDVLLKGQEAATWKIRDCVCIPREPTYTTALAIRYLDLLEKTEGERWFRIKPKLTSDRSAPSQGAVGVLKRKVRYWHTTPEGTGDYPVKPEDIELVAPARLEGSIRRWIAHRLAWWAGKYLEHNRAHITSNGIIDAVPESDMARVTSDAKIAASALARETIAYGDLPDFLQRAGFVGPDDWYLP